MKFLFFPEKFYWFPKRRSTIPLVDEVIPPLQCSPLKSKNRAACFVRFTGPHPLLLSFFLPHFAGEGMSYGELLLFPLLSPMFSRSWRNYGKYHFSSHFFLHLASASESPPLADPRTLPSPRRPWQIFPCFLFVLQTVATPRSIAAADFRFHLTAAPPFPMSRTRSLQRPFRYLFSCKQTEV